MTTLLMNNTKTALVGILESEGRIYLAAKNKEWQLQELYWENLKFYY